jgi:hypothetical protein
MNITAPLFPLPNVVFFPRTNLPLHIFEPRYRQLMRDALNCDRRMAIGLLRPGWESSYYGNPPVYEVCCVGRIENFEELEDGKFNLVLAGEEKIRIDRVISDDPYRTVAATVLQDRVPAALALAAQREHLVSLAGDFFKLSSRGELDLSALQALDYESLVNSLASHLGLPPEHKQQLLELDDFELRGRQVARFLQSQIQESQVFRQFQHLSPKDPTRN